MNNNLYTPNRYSSAAFINYYNNVNRPAGSAYLPIPGQTGHSICSYPQTTSYVQYTQNRKSPNPISDFFCADKHVAYYPYRE